MAVIGSLQSYELLRISRHFETLHLGQLQRWRMITRTVSLTVSLKQQAVARRRKSDQRSREGHSVLQ